jgi:hypothetical protein
MKRWWSNLSAPVRRSLFGLACVLLAALFLAEVKREMDWRQQRLQDHNCKLVEKGAHNGNAYLCDDGAIHWNTY